MTEARIVMSALSVDSVVRALDAFSFNSHTIVMEILTRFPGIAFAGYRRYGRS